MIARLDEAQIANARMNDMHDVWAAPAARRRASAGARSTRRRARSPRCCRRALPTASTPRMDAVPALGEHTDAILAELGWSADRIAALRAAGAV